MVLAPLEIVDRGGCAGVVAVRIRRTGKRGGSVSRTRIVTVGIPVQALGCPVENSVEGQPGSRRGGEQQGSGKIVSRVGLAENRSEERRVGKAGAERGGGGDEERTTE